MPRAHLKHRVVGAVLLALSVAIVVLVFHFRYATVKTLFVVPLLAAWGGWALAFGYPTGEDGMAPRWWRIGLVATAVILEVLTAIYVFP